METQQNGLSIIIRCLVKITELEKNEKLPPPVLQKHVCAGPKYPSQLNQSMYTNQRQARSTSNSKN